MPASKTKDIDSPCVGICLYDVEARVCIGCWRTLDEIQDWEDFTAEEKQKTVKVASIRRINNTH